MKKWMRNLVLGMSLLLLTACQSNNQNPQEDTSLTDIQSKGKLVVATETGFPPFVFKTLVNGSDTIVGSDVEMVKAIAQELGVEVEFSEMSFDNVLTSIENKKADIGISGISITEERQQVFDFSIPYYTAQNKLIIKKSNSTAFTSIDDLASSSVGAQKGSVQESVVKEQLPTSNLVSLPQTAEMVNQLKNGQLQAIVLEEPIAKGYVEKNSDLMIAAIALNSDKTDAYAIALPKGNTALKKEIDAVLEELIASGQIEKMIQEAYELSITD